MASPPPETWIRVGVVGKCHGIKGAFKLHLDNPNSQTLVPGLAVQLIVGGKPRAFEVLQAKNGVIAFEGLTDRNAAEALVNSELQVRRGDFVEDDDDDSAFLVDLIGVDVVGTDGTPLGVIESFTDNVAQVLANVRTPDGREVMVPFLPPIVVSVGPPVVLAPPGGLFDDEAALIAADQAGEIKSS